uniref:Uncharacterized protein n=1 Tax=Aegilops tauschii subsp. strangulata TaxID=200361 RepID=A0A453AN69_AEGTS
SDRHEEHSLALCPLNVHNVRAQEAQPAPAAAGRCRLPDRVAADDAAARADVQDLLPRRRGLLPHHPPRRRRPRPNQPPRRAPGTYIYAYLLSRTYVRTYHISLCVHACVWVQHWYKDMRHSTRVSDAEGHPAFALVNKATGLAVKHSLG